MEFFGDLVDDEGHIRIRLHVVILRTSAHVEPGDVDGPEFRVVREPQRLDLGIPFGPTVARCPRGWRVRKRTSASLKVIGGRRKPQVRLRSRPCPEFSFLGRADCGPGGVSQRGRPSRPSILRGRRAHPEHADSGKPATVPTRGAEESGVHPRLPGRGHPSAAHQGRPRPPARRPHANPSGLGAALRGGRDDLDQRIIGLQHLRDRLSGCIGCGCLSLGLCKLVNPDDLLGQQGPGPRNL